jgi:hypothetical protein
VQIIACRPQNSTVALVAATKIFPDDVTITFKVIAKMHMQLLKEAPVDVAS